MPKIINQPVILSCRLFNHTWNYFFSNAAYSDLRLLGGGGRAVILQSFRCHDIPTLIGRKISVWVFRNFCHLSTLDGLKLILLWGGENGLIFYIVRLVSYNSMYMYNEITIKMSSLLTPECHSSTHAATSVWGFWSGRVLSAAT